MKFGLAQRTSRWFLHKRTIGLILGPVIFAAIIFGIPFDDDTLTFEAKVVLASTFWMAAWWITEAIPIYVTALLPLVMFPLFGVTGIDDTSANYADRVVFLFLGGFLLAKAIEKTGLHRRFALTLLRLFGTTPKYIIAAFMIVTGFLSAWMSNTATAMLMLPIAVAVISQLSTSFSSALDALKRDRFAACLMLSVAYSASIGGMATLIGSPPNAIFASLSQSVAGASVSFTSWMIVALPISAVSLFVAWWYMVNLGSKVTDIPPITKERGLISRQLDNLGKMDRNEKLALAVFAATAIAWITRGLLWKDLVPMIDDSAIAIIAAISLFILPWSSSSSTRPHHSQKIRSDVGNTEESSISSPDDNNHDITTRHDKSHAGLLDWQTAVKIPWGVLLLIGGGIALANGYTTTGLDDWIAGQLGFLAGMHYILIILIIAAVTVFASEIISNTATAALIIPIAASLAASLGVSPLLLMAPVAISASYGFIMPVGTPPNAIVFASGHVTAAKMARAGLPLDIIGIVIVTVLASILVPFVWE